MEIGTTVCSRAGLHCRDEQILISELDEVHR